MNKQRRTDLANALAELEEASSIIETAKDEEEEYMNNIPENLQESYIYERASEYVDDLNNVFDDLQDIISTLSDIIER